MVVGRKTRGWWMPTEGCTGEVHGLSAIKAAGNGVRLVDGVYPVGSSWPDGPGRRLERGDGWGVELALTEVSGRAQCRLDRISAGERRWDGWRSWEGRRGGSGGTVGVGQEGLVRAADVRSGGSTEACIEEAGEGDADDGNVPEPRVVGRKGGFRRAGGAPNWPEVVRGRRWIRETLRL